MSNGPNFQKVATACILLTKIHGMYSWNQCFPEQHGYLWNKKFFIGRALENDPAPDSFRSIPYGRSRDRSSSSNS